MTRPEQSKPDGEAPPQRYGTPRYCSAIETTLEWPGAGAGPTGAGGGGELELELELEAGGAVAATGATVFVNAWAGVTRCAAIRAASSRRSSACRAASCRCSVTIWPLIVDNRARR